MYYNEIYPPDDLKQVAQCFWQFEIAPNVPTQPFSIIPDGCISITYCRFGHGIPPALRITGPRLEALEIPLRPGTIYWGIRLTAYPGAALLRLPAAKLRDQLADAVVATPTLAKALVDKLEECVTGEEAARAYWDVLRNATSQMHEVDNRLVRAINQIMSSEGAEPISDVAEAIGLSVRQLQRIFLTETGLSPKEFARVRRLRCSFVSMRKGQGPGAEVAADKGYADQAHLNKDCRGIMRATPEAVKDKSFEIEYGAFK